MQARPSAAVETTPTGHGVEVLWWLLQEVAVACRRASDRQLAAAGTSSDQVQALRLLGAGELTVGALSRQLGLERNSGSQLVERLVQRGLVERVRSHDDRRRVGITISAAGRQLLGQAQPVAAAVAGTLLAGLPENELAAATRVLLALRIDGQSRHAGISVSS